MPVLPKLPAVLRAPDDLAEALRSDLPLTGVAIRGADLREGVFPGLDLRGGLLSGCALTGCTLTGAAFQDVRFEDCDLSNARLDGAFFQRCELVSCKLMGAVLDGASLRERFAIMGRHYGFATAVWRHLGFIPRAAARKLKGVFSS